jgi:hypothetical protein
MPDFHFHVSKAQKISSRYQLTLAVVREDHSWSTIQGKDSRDRFEIRDTITTKSINKWVKGIEPLLALFIFRATFKSIS